jgi:hypothetical protein
MHNKSATRRGVNKMHERALDLFIHVVVVVCGVYSARQNLDSLVTTKCPRHLDYFCQFLCVCVCLDFYISKQAQRKGVDMCALQRAHEGEGGL